jgi:DNA-binding MarR family transcriptional regulator
MTDLDRLIHEPARLRLMSTLYVVEEADFVNVSARTGFSAGNLSSHIAKLEQAGYVEVTKAFMGKRPRTTYRLTDVGRRAFEEYRGALADLLATPDSTNGLIAGDPGEGERRARLGDQDSPAARSR